MNGRGGEAALVSSAISQRSNVFLPVPGGKARHFAVEQFEVQRQSIRIVRPPKSFPSPVKTLRGAVDSFSAKSQRRLRLAAANADPELISMFVATYADAWPKDGKEGKKQLNTFLVAVRRRLPKCSYLWVLEFQERGAPHYHLFLSEKVTPELHKFLADTWGDIATSGLSDLAKEKHAKVHNHKKAFIDWSMGSGAYVAKYLDKANQKDVPEGYSNVGRFWGASRGLVPPCLRVQADEMEVALFDRAPKAVKQAVRWLCKWHERHTRRMGSVSYVLSETGRWMAEVLNGPRGGSSRARKRSSSYMLPTGAAAFRQICKYLRSRPVLSASSWWDDFAPGQTQGGVTC